jgi:hypothetical protein
MDEGRKRVLAIVAGILVARHLNTADDLFGGPQGSPRTDAMVAAAVQWADISCRRSTLYSKNKNRATVHVTVALNVKRLESHMKTRVSFRMSNPIKFTSVEDYSALGIGLSFDEAENLETLDTIVEHDDKAGHDDIVALARTTMATLLALIEYG